MTIEEIKAGDLNPQTFIENQCRSISEQVGATKAVNALSGGVDSSVTTLLAHRALGDRLLTYFIDNGLMRQGEPAAVVAAMGDLGVPVTLVDAREEFFAALAGKIDPEEKRQAITDTFYKTVFGRLVRESGASSLLQGTIYTDVEETVAGIKRQHNILAQLGIDTEAAYGYKVVEPLIQLRKTGVRAVGKALGMPEAMYNRPPFPGPALAARVIGEVTPARIERVRAATAVVEQDLAGVNAFQYLAILHEDRVTGMREGKRDYGWQIEIRCWDSENAVIATPTELPFEQLLKMARRITAEVPGVVSVTYNITAKPPSTIEAV
ncbi:MAG: ExsB family transcriptional regulator [Desulfobacterales bacterium]|jgi:GMP synthase (glutamine-hydrolysing)|nr:ExsB family transcriptional regulator [Desulfobacterales bacterium]